MDEVDRERVVAELLARAEILLDLSRSKEAIPVLGKALVAEPENLTVQCQLARALNDVAENKQALVVIENALRQYPENEWPHRLRAQICIDLGQAKQALASAREASRLEPEHPFTQFILARSLVEVKKYRKARTVAENMIRQWPEDVSGYQILGFVLIKMEKWTEAEKYLAEALRLDPEDQHSIHNLGVAVQFQGFMEDAIHTYFTAIKTSPKNSNVVDALYFTLKNYLKTIDPHWSVRKRLEKFHPAIYNFYMNESTRRNQGSRTKYRIRFIIYTILAFSIAFIFTASERGAGMLAARDAAIAVATGLAVVALYKLYSFTRRKLLEWSYGKPVLSWFVPTLFGPFVLVYVGVSGMMLLPHELWVPVVLLGIVLSARLILIRAGRNFRYWWRSRTRYE